MSSRRDLIRGGAIAVGVGVVGAAGLAAPAAAADGDALLLGDINGATSHTDLRLGGSGALGNNVFTAQDASFAGSAVPAAVGGYATGGRVGNGLYGYTSGTIDSHTNSGYAVAAFADNRGSTTRAQIWMFPAGAAPTADAILHRAGELAVSADARLWFCTVSGTPGIWQEITGDRALIAAAQAAADAAASDAANLQVQVDAIAPGPTFFPTSQRAFDSRPAEPASGGAKGLFGDAENRTIDLTVDTDFPAGAKAAIVHLTLARSASAAGYLSVYSAAVANLNPPGFSSLNWATTGWFEANTTVSAVSPEGHIKVFALHPAHVVVDIIGYYA